MVPLRVDHGRVAVLVLVIPVVIVALSARPGRRSSLPRAQCWHTTCSSSSPTTSSRSPTSDEVVAALTLFAVAVIVGVLSARLVRINARASARREELQHVLAFARLVTDNATRSSSRAACEHITSVLDLDRCSWEEGLGDATTPTLLADGNLMGRVTDLNPDRATLPDHLEIPVWIDDIALGRFVAVSNSRHVVSYEERVTAATIARLYGRAVRDVKLRSTWAS